MNKMSQIQLGSMLKISLLFKTYNELQFLQKTYTRPASRHEIKQPLEKIQRKINLQFHQNSFKIGMTICYNRTQFVIPISSERAINFL